MEALLRSPATKTNVLCLGFRGKRPSGGGIQLRGSAYVEAYHRNGATGEAVCACV